MKVLFITGEFPPMQGGVGDYTREIGLALRDLGCTVAIASSAQAGPIPGLAVYPAIKSFDTEGRVIYLGTMSKIFCPGLRIGWIYGKSEVVNKFNLIKQGVDLQCNSMAQRECAVFLDMYDINAHIKTIVDTYRHRRDLMIKTVNRT